MIVLTGLILKDASLCELLSPVTIEFVAGLNAILEDSSLDDAHKKEATRALLTGYGKGWIALWKQAHARTSAIVGEEGNPNFEEILKHARQVAKKQRIQALIAELEQGIALSSDDGEKLALAKAKIELIKQSQQADR